MSKCPHCERELPPMTHLDALAILDELKKVPGFMNLLGQEAAKTYFEQGIDDETTKPGQ